MEPVGGTFIVLATFCPVKSKVVTQVNELEHLLKSGEGLKGSLGWPVQPILPFCIGCDGFPPICPCP